MKEIAGLLKGAEREECVLEKPSANRAGGACRKQGQKMERCSFFPAACVNVPKLVSKWGTDKFF